MSTLRLTAAGDAAPVRVACVAGLCTAVLFATTGFAAPAGAAPPAAGAAVAAAVAPRWSVDPARSSLEFEFLQAGARNKGHFQRFPVSFQFSPGALEGSRLEVGVEMNSLDTGDKERDDTLRSADMFDTGHFAQARFASQRIVRTAQGFDAVGTLTLRGVTREVHVPFTFRSASESGREVGYLSGRTSIRRLQFGVGQGEWRSTEWVGDEVGISYTLRLLPAP